MSITSNVNFTQSAFTPFRTRVRAGVGGNEPVGSVFLRGADVGESGGGTVEISLRIARDLWGFPMFLVPTYVTADDDGTGTAKTIRFAYVASGNSRISGTISQNVAGVDDGVAIVATMDITGIVIEPSAIAVTEVFRARWSVNTLGVNYGVSFYGVVYDAQVMAERGSVPELIQGLR